MSQSFHALGVSAAVEQALAARGIVEPFYIQSLVLPDALAGRDVLGRGQTGSGKTLAFGLPMLARGKERYEADLLRLDRLQATLEQRQRQLSRSSGSGLLGHGGHVGPGLVEGLAFAFDAGG